VMMELTININNNSQTESYTALIISMIKQRFSGVKDISNVDVQINESQDSRVPWMAVVTCSNSSDELLKAESSSANFLSAFTQALSKLERKLDKLLNGA